VESDRKDSTSQSEGCVEVERGGVHGDGVDNREGDRSVWRVGGLVIIDVAGSWTSLYRLDLFAAVAQESPLGAGTPRMPGDGGEDALSTPPSGHMRQTAGRRFVQWRSRQPQK